MGVSSFHTSKTKRLSWTTKQALLPLPPTEWGLHHIHRPSNTKAGIIGVPDSRQEFDLYETKEKQLLLF